MSPVEGNKKLPAFLKKLRSRFNESAFGEPPVAENEPHDADIDTLVYSMLLWEATNTQARAAWKRLREHFVDYNDIRAALADEIAAVLGEKYPKAMERSLRLRSTLNDIYRRFHAVTLSPVRDMGKRDQKALFESLEGLPPFAAFRTLLLRLDVHAIPADDRLRDMLAEEGVIEESMDPIAVSHLLERHIYAESAKAVCGVLESWVEADHAAPKKDRKQPVKASKSSGRAPAKKAKSSASPKKSSKGKSGG
ncbi:MAG: hypothetical protein ACK54H_08440 [Phycisphaerales bacterium]